MRRRRHRIIPSLEFDRLENRAMLDGSDNGGDDPEPEIQALYEEVESSL